MPHFLLRPLTGTFVAVAAAVAAAGSAGSATAAIVITQDPQVCQYSYDQAWRAVPVTLSGTLKNDASETEISPSTPLAVGDRVRLEDATVQADLPGWIAPFAFDGGVIKNGTSEVPIKAWIALEATNTVEGVTPPIPLETKAIAHAEVPEGGTATEQNTTFDPVVADIPTRVWTATGGDVEVRQAIATKMAPIPVGRDGGNVRVNGTLFVSAQLDSATRLFLDCLAGEQRSAGLGHSDLVPSALGGGIPVPGFTGTIDGGPLMPATPVDASLQGVGLPRAAAGTPATVAGSKLRLRLTPAQRSAWLGPAGTATISGSLPLAGNRSREASGEAAITGSAAASGADEVLLDVAPSTWTPTGDVGVDVSAAGPIELTATGPAGSRVLRLARTHASAPSPFAYVLGPDPRAQFDDGGAGDGGVGVNNPPPLDTVGPGVIAPPPVLNPAPVVVPPKADPKPVRRIAPVKLGGSTLKRSRGRLKVTLQNLVAGVTKGRLSLVTKSKYKVGKAKKAKRITLLKATSFSLPKGKKKTFSLKLSKDATALLKRRRSVKATLTATPSAASTQKVVSRTVTVRR